MADHPEIRERRQGARRTAVKVGLIALAVFLGYILLVAVSR